MTEGWIRPTRGTPRAPVLIVCDSPGAWAYGAGLPMDGTQLKWLGEAFAAEGMDPRSEFLLVGLCPVVPDALKKNAKKKWEFVESHLGGLNEVIEENRPRVVVTFGELATRAVVGRSLKITKARGVVIPRTGAPPVLPMLSPGFIDRLPDHKPTFLADVHSLAMLKAAGWVTGDVDRTETRYEWATDISHLLGANKPRVIAVDTEGTGLRWWSPEVIPITVQFAVSPGRSYVCCVDEVYWRRWLTPVVGPYSHRARARLVGQLRELLEDPDVRKIGQNLKFDDHILRKLKIDVRGWLHDTMLLGFAVDENAMSLSLDELVRIHVAEMSGYADDFNRTYDKSKMRDVPPEDMLLYAGGDPDATLRLARVLQSRLRADPKQQRAYRKIQIPAIQCFSRVTEQYGIRVDKERLRDLSAQVGDWLAGEYRELIRMVPPAVRRRHLDAKKELVFSRPDFVRDALFSGEGFGLSPVVFTDSTADLEDPAERVASTSAKVHLPYFTAGDHLSQEVKNFVTRLIEFQRTSKLKGTYYGEEDEGTGFWQYLDASGYLHPSFGVTFTNTGRTNSRDPNAQNFPKRGSRWAKPFGEVFIPSDGYTLVGADLSQIELRIAAWMAMEPTMLRIYREGGDIHATTAAAVLGVPNYVFASWKDDERTLVEVANTIPGSGGFLRQLNPGSRAEAKVKDFFSLKRFQAKAVNFGFIYGMGWRKFMQYAKTEYAMDVTEAEARLFRSTFFSLYPGLVPWHQLMRDVATEQGYVRALHGSARHLPSINSTDPAIRGEAQRQAINAPVQRFGSDLGLIGFVRLTQQADPRSLRALNFIHDQLVVEVRDEDLEESARAVKWVMQTPPLWEWFDIESPIPILSDLQTGPSLGAMRDSRLTEARPAWWRDDEGAAAQDFYRRAA